MIRLRNGNLLSLINETLHCKNKIVFVNFSSFLPMGVLDARQANVNTEGTLLLSIFGT